MTNTNHLRIFSDPLVDQNPVTLQILGICSALAVTTSVLTALVMSLALTFVLACSNVVISAIRKHIPNTIRLIVQIVIIASLVIVADELLKAFAFGISQRLSVYVGLIVTNCIVLARAETFAMHNPPLPSLLDGLGNGAGYSIILVPIGTFRELTGSGSLLGYPVLTTINGGGWFEPLTFMLKPAAAFFILGFTVWLIRSLRRDQVEKLEFEPQSAQEKV